MVWPMMTVTATQLFETAICKKWILEHFHFHIPTQFSATLLRHLCIIFINPDISLGEDVHFPAYNN